MVVRYVDVSNASALVGAGASRDAGFPIAYELLDSLSDLMIAPDWARESVQHLARWQRPDRHGDHDFLRFETFVDWVLEVFDDERSLFAFIELFKVPTSIDTSLARVARDGLRLLTVNFDDLLERAIEIVSPGAAVTIDAHASRSTRPANSIPVFKLHGTVRLHIRGRSRRSSRPLHATIKTIAAGSPEFTLGGRARQIFDENVTGRELVVVGYSGSDTLDVVPALAESSPARVLWLDHNQSLKRPVVRDLADLEDRPWQPLLLALQKKGVDVDVLSGPTVLCLSAIGIRCGPPIPVVPPSWWRSLQTWADKNQHHDPTGLGTAGLIFGELGRYKEALRAHRAAKASLTADGSWTEPRRLYEIGQSHYLKTPANLAAAETWARRSLDRNRRSGWSDSDARFMALTLIARVAFIRNEFPRARRLFAQAARAVPKGSANWAHAMAWRGRVFTWEVRPKDALPCLEAARDILLPSGDMQARLDIEEPLGIVYGWLGRSAEGEQRLRAAIHAAHVLGWEDRRYAARQALASLMLDEEKFADAIEETLRALAEYPSPENEEAAEGLEVIGDAYLELGDLDNAKHYFGLALANEVLGRGRRGRRIARLAEVALIAGERAVARRQARKALSQPSRWRTPSGNATAFAVLYSLGDVDEHQLAEHLRMPQDTPLPHVRELARTLDRLGVSTSAARRVIDRASLS